MHCGGLLTCIALEEPCEPCIMKTFVYKHPRYLSLQIVITLMVASCTSSVGCKTLFYYLYRISGRIKLYCKEHSCMYIYKHMIQQDMGTLSFGELLFHPCEESKLARELHQGLVVLRSGMVHANALTACIVTRSLSVGIIQGSNHQFDILDLQLLSYWSLYLRYARIMHFATICRAEERDNMSSCR